MIKRLSLFVLICIGVITRAQNLVLNPSFETITTSCSGFGGAGYINLANWDNPDPTDTCSTPDWFSTCLSSFFPTHAPNSWLGNQAPRTGAAYAGAILYDASSNSYREYIEGKLSSPLVAGQTYCVSFYVSLADTVPYATNGLGVYFSNSFVQFPVSHCTSAQPLPYTPQLQYTGPVLTNDASWTLISWNYTATGGEQYITIGNFKNNAATTTTNVGGSFFNPFAYYFFDDVSVTPGPCCIAGITQPSPVCVSSAPITLSAATAGGTWSGPGITNGTAGTFDPSIAGVGTQTITYTMACGTETVSIVVNSCAAPTTTVCSQSNGSFLASGGTAPYTWQSQSTTQNCSSCIIGCVFPPGCAVNVTTWSTYATGASATPPGTYPIRVISATGDTVVINSAASVPACVSCPTLTPSLSAVTPVACFGQSTGSFNVSTTGGQSPYDYSLSNAGGQVAVFINVTGSQSFTGLAAGNYTLSVMDDNGCPGSATLNISQPAAALAVSITSSTDASCGNPDGTATAQASNGTGPYQYIWTGASGVLQTTTNTTSADVLNNLAAGTYTVTITDNHNCTTSTTVTINNSGGPTASVTSQTDILCNGGTTGGATVTASGGSSPYDYVWTDANGTVHTDNNIPGASTASGLPAGSYTITITDNGNCVTTQTLTLAQPSLMDASITAQSNILCFGAATGTATAHATGGTVPYDYVWSDVNGVVYTDNNNPGSSTATGLAAGNYTVAITDSNGCVKNQPLVITQPATAVASVLLDSTEVLCNGALTGAAIDSASGGTGPYQYVWSNASGVVLTHINMTTSSAAGGLAAGSYTVTVTDNNGCTTTQSVTIDEPSSPLSATLTSSTNASCAQSDGNAVVTASGGTSTYDYVWTGVSGVVQTDNNQAGPSTESTLAAGSYTVSITDNNGCTASVNVTISNPAGPGVALTTQTNNLCSADSNGSAVLTPIGNDPFDFTWVNSSNVVVHSVIDIPGADTASSLAAGVYNVSVADSAGCITMVTVTITAPSPLSASLSSSTEEHCSHADGTATITASGGTPGTGYTYSWLPSGGTAATATGLSANVYTVTVSDSAGCMQTLTVNIDTLPRALASVPGYVNVGCNGASTGGISIAATGTGPFDYAWINSSGVTVHSVPGDMQPLETYGGLPAGTYTVTVTNQFGCVSDAVVTLTEPPVLTLAQSALTNEACNKGNGAGSVTAAGGSPGTGYTYTWLPSGGSGTSASGLSANNYTVTVTDSAGCTASATLNIANIPGPAASVASQTNITCNGGSDGSATIAGTGGTGTLTYSWSGGISNTATANNLGQGTYLVTVTDSLNCSTVTSVTITQPPPLLLSFSGNNAICKGNSTTLTVSGAQTYFWIPDSVSGNSITVNPQVTSTYTVNAISASGCTTSSTYTVIVSNNPVAGFDISNTSVLVGSTVQFDNTSSGGTAWYWAFGTGNASDTSSLFEPSFTYADTGYFCTLQITANLAGCFDTLYKCVDVIDVPHLTIPNIFSPNNGDNVNDLFTIKSYGYKTISVTIYDRWGLKMAEYDGLTGSWNGKNLKGEEASVGSYYYIINAVDRLDASYETKGFLLLVR